MDKESFKQNLINQMTRRKSPLGYDESVSSDLPPGIMAITQHSRFSNIPDSVYSPQYYNDPEIMAHERIHQGQSVAGGTPTSDQLFNALKPMMDRQKYDSYLSSYGRYPDNVNEPPAYAFSSYDPNDQRQGAYNNYIDLMNSINRGHSQSIIASSSQDLQKGYFNHPIPPLDPSVGTVKPMSLIDTIRYLIK